jgi:protein-tyrosine phosphatase
VKICGGASCGGGPTAIQRVRRRRALASFVRAQPSRPSLFLHCVDGRSRTPTVAAAFLAVRDRISGRDAWEQVAGVIPAVAPHDHRFQGFLDGLVAT